jgi:peptidoglycan/xylan/chitin deacetylase (PgdA/CDA1 family)
MGIAVMTKSPTVVAGLILVTGFLLGTCQSHPLTGQTPTSAQGLFTFVFDDGFETDFSIVRPIFMERGLRAGIAIITGWVGRPGVDTVDEIRQLRDDGFEIMSHTVTHPHLPRLTDEQIEYELAKSQADLASWGVPVDSLVYPYNQNNQKVRAIAAKHYRYARAGQRQLNYDLSNPYSLFSHPFERDLGRQEDLVDQAAKQNAWIFFYHHRMEASIRFDDKQGQFLEGEPIRFEKSGLKGQFFDNGPVFFGRSVVYGPMTDGNPIQGEKVIGLKSGASCLVRDVEFNDRDRLEQLLDYVRRQWPNMKMVLPKDGFRLMADRPTHAASVPNSDQPE